MEFDHGTRFSGVSMRERLLALAIGLAALTAAGVIAAQWAYTKPGSAPRTSVRVEAVAVEILVPGKDPVRALATRGAGKAGTRSYSYPAAGSIVRVTDVATRSAADPLGAVASSSVEFGRVDLLDGRITADGLRLEASSAIVEDTADGSIRATSRSGLRVGRENLPLNPNGQIALNRMGTIVVNEQALVSVARKGDDTTGPRYRVTGAALHVRLTHRVGELPAGTQIVIGRVDVGVRREKAAKATATPARLPAGLGTSIDGVPQPGQAALPRRAATVNASATPATGNLEGYTFPVLGVANYSNDYGAPRATTGTHQGNDIFAAQGTPLVAVTDGVLDRVGWNGVGGHRLWLFDRYGNGFYYAHLSAFATTAVEGATVRAGQVVGFMGTTGDAQGTPPHVHFEVHPGNAGPTNPFPYLNAWKHGSPVRGVAAIGAKVPALVLLESHDASTRSGLAQTLFGSSAAASYLPVSHEGNDVPDGASLESAIAGDVIAGDGS